MLVCRAAFMAGFGAGRAAAVEESRAMNDLAGAADADAAEWMISDILAREG